MNKAELVSRTEAKIKELTSLIREYNDEVEAHKSNIEECVEEITALDAYLAELNKKETGRVKIGDDLSEVDVVFRIDYDGVVCEWYSDAKFFIKQGRTFYDRATAELFALREKTKFKIWCKFSRRFVITYPGDGLRCEACYLGVSYCGAGHHDRFHNFLDTLSEEELNSIRSE